MPNYTEFEGVNLITDPTQKTIAQVLIKNELGGVSNGYQLDHAGTSNSGYSFGGNQMDLSKNANGREIFSTIIKAELGDNFYNSIKDRVVQTGNQNILTQQEQNQINSALSSNYGKQLINQAFVDEVNVRSSHVDDFAKLLNTTFTNDVKIALVDYDNQFYIDFTNTGSSSMRTKLQNILNKNGEITLEDVENSVRSTGYYNSSPSATKSQEKRIQDTRKMIEDAGLVSDGSDSTASLKNSLVTTLATITVTAQKEAAAKSWFETFSDSLGSWTGSVTNFMKEAASDVVNFFSSPGESLSKIGSWISSAFTFGESDKVPDSSTINNSLLNLEINTNLTSGFAGSNDLGQTGNVIGDADWRATMPINVINGDGYKNVASAGIVSDGFRPGNMELSQYANFNTQLNVDYDKLNSFIVSSTSNNNSYLQSSLFNSSFADIANQAINARNFLNIDPVVLDLNGDGVKLTSYNDSEVTFDVDNDGKQERTGWVTKQDGILVDDKNHNGKIDNITETISEYYNPNDGSVADVDGKYSTDGLAALKKLDSNHDGKFNNQDAKWNDLRIWQDANGNGVTDLGELKTLNEAGIKEFDLSGITQANKERNAGNIIFSKTTYTTTDNQTKQVAAVDFTTNPIGYEFNDVNLGKLATAEDGTKSLVISDTNGATITASNDTAQNIFGNVGNDTIIGDSRDNWISGGAGSDTLKGGAGDDILIIDSEDKQENIDGGDGRDVVIINSDQGVTFNLAESHVETVVGGNGDDVLIGGGTSNVFIDGGSGDDIIIGGAADDALAGSDGNDYVDGGYGDDIVRGHRGNDVLIGGEGNDYLEGGLDDDKVFAGAGNDVIMEGDGNDEIDGGEGYDLVKYSGSYKDYKISRDGIGYKIKDLTTGNIDSIKNIEGVRFNDATLKLIDGNISPLPVADIIQVQNKTDTVFISVNDLLKNDLDVEGDTLTLISVTNSVGGFAELVKDGSGNVTGVRWTPDKSFIGNMSFDYDIKDSKGAYTIIEQRNNDGTSVTAAMKARVTFKLASDPTDDLYTKQWYLSEVNIQKAWQDYTGKGIKIGVFEKGDFNINHAELDGNTTQSYKDDVAFRQVDQFSQHATTVAGVIAAEKNGTGIVGAAYDAKLEGYSWNADATGLANLKNVDIANNSWGAVGEFIDNFSDPNNANSAYAKLLEDSVEQGRNGLGTINVFAGGNSRADGDNVNYHNLQNSRFVISTGSINQPGDLATLTEASTPFSTPGDAILVSAPGSNINSTGNLLTNANGSTFLGEFASSQGTSFSAPIISGVVALMLQANPNLGYRDVQKILALSARQFNDPNTTWQENGATNWNGGAMHFSHDYGFGEVDAAAAVRLAETWNEVSDAYNENSLITSDNSRTQIVDNGVTTKQFTISNSNMHNIETVEVQVNLTDFNISDLTIKLISPSGTESILMDKPGSSVYQGGLNFNFSSRAFLGEDVDGNWQLQITDSKTGDISYLNSWQLKFYGELNDGKSDTYIYTDEFAKMTDGMRSIIIDSDGGNDTINAAAVSTDSIINLNAGQISHIAGKDVLITGGTKGAQYYQQQALLPTKQSQLASVNSQISAKNQALTADNTEFAGIDTAISAKYSEAMSKQSAMQTAYNNVVSNELYGYSPVMIFDGAYIFQNQSGHIKDYPVDQGRQKLDQYNNLISVYNQKQSDFNASVGQYNSLLTRRDALPSEISSLQNDIATLTKQVTGLQSDINFINAYLNAFEDGKASIIENAYAGDGNDTIIGNDQDNKIWGGRGLNTETGGAGKDTFIIKQNSSTQDTITDFKIGEDKIDLSDFGSFDFSKLKILQNGSNVEITLISGQKIILQNLQSNQISASDFIIVDKSQNIINGTDANDVINGSALSDVISGGNGDDQINGNLGNDILVGNSGNDILAGGDGNDVYVFNTGDGKDVIKEYLSASNSSNDRIFFGSGITKDMVYFTKSGNDLVVKFTNSPNDQLTISDYFNKSVGGNGLEKLEFVNGDSINISDPTSVVITYTGTSGNDTITVDSGNSIINSGNGDDLIYSGTGNDIINGGSGNDEVHAGSGNDTINGGDGNDQIHDGAGNDIINGGKGDDSLALNAGDDTYVYNLGDGKDIIENYLYLGGSTQENYDNYGSDTISFGQSISKDDIYFTKSGNDLIVKFVGNEQDQITLKNHWSLKTGVTNLKFQDGSIIDVSDVTQLQFFDYVGDKNDNIINGTAHNDAFNGADGNDTISGGDGDDIIFGGLGDDILRGDNGNDIINGGDGNDVIFGGAGNNQIQGGEGNDIISLGGSDNTFSDVINLASGGAGSDTFIISDKKISFDNRIDVISDFDINDANEKINLSAVRGINKYSDLKISQQGADSQIILSTNYFGYSQILKLKNVDSTKLSAANFVITNEAPKVVDDSVSTEEDKSIIINILANDYDDKTDLTKTKITLTQPVNGTVTINSDGTVTYKPNANFNGVDQFEYQITDAGGLSSDKAKVSINIDPVNDAPVVTKIVGDQNFYSTRGINFKVNNVFTEVDGEGLSYSAALSDGSSLPSWVNFDSSTLTFSGIAPNQSENITIKLTATDDTGNSTSTDIKLKIDNNIALGTSGNDVIYGTNGNDVIDGGAGDDIINAGNGNDIIFGGAGNDRIYSSGSGSNDILTGDSGSDIFVIGNDIISDDVITDFDISDPNEKIDLSNFAVSKHGYSTVSKFSDLKITQVGNDAKITFSNSSKSVTVKNVKASDLTADKFNNAPSIASQILDQKVYITKDFSLDFTNSFADTDGDNLVYSATLQDGSALPSWLTFDAINHKITGTAPDSSSTLNVRITATDKYGDSISDDFKIFVTGFVGDSGGNTITGTDKDDVITGLRGDDILNGGSGNDTLIGGSVSALFAFGNLTDGSGSYKEVYVGYDYSADGNDTLNGGDGDDILIGGSVDSKYVGSFPYGDGNDILNGGAGNDILKGGSGYNSLTGGTGSDIFVIENNVNTGDTITDFDVNDPKEKIDLSSFGDQVSDFAKLKMTQVGSDVRIDIAASSVLDNGQNYTHSQSVTIKNVSVDQLTIDKFIGVTTDSRTSTDNMTVIGTNGNDILRSGFGDDILNGLSGDDDIAAGAGNDTLSGGDGNDILSGGSGSDKFVIQTKSYSWESDIILDFDVNDQNEQIDLTKITNVGFADLVITQQGPDSTIQLPSQQKILLKNVDKSSLTADKFLFYSNPVNGSSINDNLSDSDGNDLINAFGGNDVVSLGNKGSDTVNLGDGNDSFSVSGNSYYGSDNVTGGAGNDTFSVDLGYSYGDSNYSLTIKDFEAKNPNEKIYISNGSWPIVDFNKDLKIDQIGNDVQISLNGFGSSKKLILKNVNKADLSESNIILPKVGSSYSVITSNHDDVITFDQTAVLENVIGKDFKIPASGSVNAISSFSKDGQTIISFYVTTDNGWVKETLVNASVFVGQNLTTYTFNSFDAAKDRLGIDPSYKITRYSDLPLSQVGSDVVMNFTDQKIKVVLKNTNISDLKEDDFVFYNHSTAQDDIINGGNGNDYIEGGDGNDTISGDGGDDLIFGGNGNDNLSDYSGNNKLYGGAGNDNFSDGYSYYGNQVANNEFYGEEGRDEFDLSSGINLAKGGIGNDSFYVSGGENQIYGEDGIDDFTIARSYTTTFDGNGIVTQDTESKTTIYDFDPLSEKITLEGFDQDGFNQINIIQDGNDVVLNLTDLQTVRLSNVSKASLNQDNIIIPDKHIQDNYYYTFDDRTNEYAINDLNKLITENPSAFYQGPVAEIASSFDPISMKMVSDFDVSQDKIYLGKIKTLEKFEDLKITQNTVNQSYGSPLEFTLIDLGNGSFVKLNGFYNLTADNFVFDKAPVANLTSVSVDKGENQKFDVLAKATDADDDFLSIAKITDPSHGTALIVTDEQGKQKISYTPNPNFSGFDQIDYTISDGRGGVVTKTLNITINNSVNIDPIATIDSALVNEDNSLIIDVLSGASDTNGDTLSLVATYDAQNGIANIVDGKIVYTPNTNYNGIDSFEYLISDGNGGFVLKKLNVTVNSVNDAPVVENQLSAVSTDEDSSKEIISAATIASAFSDPDSDVLTFKATLVDGKPLPSWLVFDGVSGALRSVNPTNGDVGSYSVVITATDPSNASVSQNFLVTVNNVNDAPTAQAVLSSTNEDTQKLTLAFNASDVDVGDVLTYSILSNPALGSVVNNNDGTFTFNLGNDFQNLALGHTKDVSFTYVATDKAGAQSNVSTATITVTGTNDLPTASVTSIATNEDNSVKIDVLAGASDILSLTSVANGSHGTASIVTDASGTKVISYVPNANYNGNDVITYTISDNNGGSVTKELTVTVNAVNDAPIVASAAQNQSTQSGKAFTYQLPNNLFSDVDGDTLTIKATLADGSPLPSWLSFDGSKFSGTPNVSVTTNFGIKLTATDPSGASVSSNFGINVTNPNNAPVAKDDAFATNEDTSLTISFASILKNDSDVEDKTDIQKLTKDNIIFNNPSNGTITVTDTGIIYKPNKDYNGSDVITYQIKDSGGALSNVASIKLTVNSVNDIAVAGNDSFVTDEDKPITIKLSDLLANDSDVEDGAAIQSLTMDKFVFSNPSKGTIVKDAANGTITYTPTKDFNGADSLTYQIKDSSGALSNKATISLTVNAVNDAPVAVNDSFTLNEDTPLTISFASILKNDSDVEDGVNIQKITKDNIVFNNPLNGKITITDTGIIYTPNKDFNGSDSLTYQIKDSSGALSNSANINLTIKSVNDAPVAASDSFVTDEDTAITIKISDLLANDFDVEDGVNIQNTTFDKFVFTNPGKGVIVKDAVNGTITYTPNKNYNGTDVIYYQIKDSSGALSNKAAINLAVNSVNDAPVAVNDSFTTNEDTSLTISFASILANDSDVEDGANIKNLTKDNIIFNNPSNGTITITDTGIVYKPNKDYNGSDVITYQIKDSVGALSNVSSINLTIKAVNDIAVAGNDSFVTDEDKSITIKLSDLLANDSDVEDGAAIQSLTMDKFVFSNPSKGAIVKDAANGTITYTPTKDFNGADSLTYQIKDSNGALSNKATISLTVNAVNDAPIVATKLANQTNKAGNSFSYTLPTNAFSDVDKDTLTYSAKLANDSDLPSWLKFDATTKTFSGISPSGAASTLAIKVIASDGSLSASQNFNLAISSNLINGTAKNDSLNGTTFNDEIYGNDGVDTIKGNAGNDLIIGGKGADVLYGGIGNDQFIFKNLNESTINESDLIMDFIRGEDKINLSDLGFDSISNGLGTTTSSHGLEYYFDGKNTVIDDPNSNFAVKLAGDIKLDAGDVIF